MIIHPLLKLTASQPQLLADHAEAYLALAAEEAGKLSSSWSRRLRLYAAAAVLALVGILLGGVALLLAAAVPSDPRPAAWVLYVVPLTPLGLALILVLIARSQPRLAAFEALKAQFLADKALLSEVSSP